MADTGTDVSTYVTGQSKPGVSPQYATITGPRTVVEQLARALETERGSLFWDPGFGFDVRGFLNETIDARAIAKIRAGALEQARRDDRIKAARVSVTVSGPLDSQTISVAFVLTLADGSTSRKTVAISALTTEILDS